MPNKIDPFSGIVSLINVIASGATGDDVPGRDDVFRDDVGDQIVDTVCAFDSGSWETGIRRDDHWIIVEQYDDREAAEAGHKAWVAKLTADPALKLSDVMVWDL